MTDQIVKRQNTNHKKLHTRQILPKRGVQVFLFEKQ